MQLNVEEILQSLINLPLWSIGRAGNLEWFAFGAERKEVSLRDGTRKIVSEYALHIQCAWRIRHRNKIIVASGDRSYPSGNDPYQNLFDFDSDKQGENQLDQRILKFLEEQGASPLVVSAVQAEESGSFCLALNQVYYLDVFPDNSIVSEYWRFFSPYSAEEHFVFTNEGIKRE